MTERTCPVVYADGTTCGKPLYGLTGWCQACWSWHYNRGGERRDPSARIPRTRKSRKKTCTVVEGGVRCTMLQHSYGVCNKHRYRVQSNGDPLTVQRAPKGTMLNFLISAARYTEDDCLYAPMDASGHRPNLQASNSRAAKVLGITRDMPASRAVWFIAHGDPGDLHVLHTCHQGMEGCVNIRHLYLGTHDQNVADMLEADRQVRGMRNGHAKVTDAEVLEIRRLAGTVPQRELAARYGLTQSGIDCIITGRNWKHLPGARDRREVRSLPRGERSGTAKVTAERVREIRSLAGTASHREIGERFGVSRSLVQSIISRRTWAHLD